jgi:hypothetical protein
MPRGAPAVTSRRAGSPCGRSSDPSRPPARSSGRPGRAGQTLTRARPLRRRAARIARPARVRMRNRNPCVFARWRLFGWNVRLLTGTPGTGRPARALTDAPRGFQDMLNRARPVAGPTERYAGQRRRSKGSGMRGSATVKPARRPGPSAAAALRPRFVRRPPVTLPMPGRHAAVARPPPGIPLADRPGSRWHPPQHLPFAKRVPNPTPRLWTSDPDRGDPDQVIA